MKHFDLVICQFNLNSVLKVLFTLTRFTYIYSTTVFDLLFTTWQNESITTSVSSVQSLSHVQLFATPWIAACQASLSITNSWNLLRLMSIESVMPSNHLILCHPLFFLPSIFPSIRVFSDESVLRIRWPKYWSFSFNMMSRYKTSTYPSKWLHFIHQSKFPAEPGHTSISKSSLTDITPGLQHSSHPANWAHLVTDF